MAMEVRRRNAGSVVVVSLLGDLDSSTAPMVQERLRSLVHPDGLVLIDLSGVRYMSSAGLRTMLLLYRQAQLVNTMVGIAGISEELRTMMSATGFLGFFTVGDTVADGVRILESGVRGPA